MVQKTPLISLGELLGVSADTEDDNEILDRVKLLAQECMPEGWTSWKVTRLSKEEVFGERVDPQVLNKLRFALPTDQLAKAFVPESNRLSEKGFRDLKMKMLDWAFTRALITSPPAISNRIRGSAAATELFNEAVRQEKPMSRKEADRALSIEADGEFPGARRRHSTDIESNDSWPHRPKRSRMDVLEQRVNEMFSTLMERFDSLESGRRRNNSLLDSSEDGNSSARSRSESLDDWRAPSVGSVPAEDTTQHELSELGFLPETKVDPDVPAPSEHVKMEGITCQRFGSESWNRIRYKEVVKRLHASPVFSALKVNPELNDLGIHTSGLLKKHDGVLGTIVHGLLCQRKALAEECKKLAAKFPSAADDLRKLLSEESNFKAKSDDLLQYVCAHRAETIEFRRKAFRPKNDALASALRRIPPSHTHLFQENRFTNFIRSNGGARRIFSSRLDHVKRSYGSFQQRSKQNCQRGSSRMEK